MRSAMLWVVVGVGCLTVLVTVFFLLQDWALLERYYKQFDITAARSHDVAAIVAAAARQDVYRLNCLAEGVGILLGAILAAIGIHGLCLLPSRGRNSEVVP